jgi:hypothetical protein
MPMIDDCLSGAFDGSPGHAKRLSTHMQQLHVIEKKGKEIIMSKLTPQQQHDHAPQMKHANAINTTHHQNLHP